MDTGIILKCNNVANINVPPHGSRAGPGVNQNCFSQVLTKNHRLIIGSDFHIRQQFYISNRYSSGIRAINEAFGYRCCRDSAGSRFCNNTLVSGDRQL